MHLDIDLGELMPMTEIEELEQRCHLYKQYTEAMTHTVISIIGGLVEGRPTNRLNYLQRLRELVKIEREATILREALHTVVAVHIVADDDMYPEESAKRIIKNQLKETEQWIINTVKLAAIEN